MPLELGVWRIDKGVVQLQATGLNLESRLEDILDGNIGIANPGWLVIGRQIDTGFGSRLDLLAIDEVGNLIVLELKRDQTPREVIAQVLEYGAWVSKVRAEDIAQIYARYVARYHPERGSQSFDDAFRQRFQLKEVPEELNQSHQLAVVASQFDETSERIVNYLADEYGVEINALFFSVFKDGDREYLARVWLRDPSETEPDLEAHEAADWNGEFYVSYGGGRNWEEARKYGFIRGGGGTFYSQTLKLLSPGNRVWVNIPGTGYVGVGEVVETRRPIEEFLVNGSNGLPVPITELTSLQVAQGKPSTEDPETAEYLVRIQWDKTVPEAEAVKELGLFGSQHTVARPRTKKWGHTVERLMTRFGIKQQ